MQHIRVTIETLGAVLLSVGAKRDPCRGEHRRFGPKCI